MSDDAPGRPLASRAEPDTGPFWEECDRHRLTFCRHPSTGEISHLPRLRDPDGTEWETVESSGNGVIYTFTVIRQHFHPYFRSRTPYVVAYVNMDEGFRLLSDVVGDPEEVRVGQRVRVEWEDEDGTAVPVFRTVAEVIA